MAKRGLNVREKLFCQLYVGQEYFGNATKCYIIAYKVKCPVHITFKYLSPAQENKYNSCSVLALRVLRKVKIKEEINKLLDALIKDEVVDRELAKVILQNEELSAKVSAIREYNKLKKRVSDDVNLKIPQTLIDLIKNGVKHNSKGD